jgi:hypothetical protein
MMLTAAEMAGASKLRPEAVAIGPGPAARVLAHAQREFVGQAERV